MKNTALILITGLALATAAQAGTSYSSKGKEVISPPPAPCLWTWFAGGSVGYVTGDWDEEIYSLHVGAEYKCPTSNCSQAIFLEVGYTENDIDFGIQLRGLSYSSEVIPITLNYKYECALTDKFNWYIGAGAGVALTEASANFVNFSDDETLFYAHIFAGVTYNVSESFELFAGVKYIFMDELDAFDGAPFEDETNLDGDLHIELGARFNF